MVLVASSMVISHKHCFPLPCHWRCQFHGMNSVDNKVFRNQLKAAKKYQFPAFRTSYMTFSYWGSWNMYKTDAHSINYNIWCCFFFQTFSLPLTSGWSSLVPIRSSNMLRSMNDTVQKKMSNLCFHRFSKKQKWAHWNAPTEVTDTFLLHHETILSLDLMEIVNNSFHIRSIFLWKEIRFFFFLLFVDSSNWISINSKLFGFWNVKKCDYFGL